MTSAPDQLLAGALDGDRAALQQLLCEAYDSLRQHIQARIKPPLADALSVDDVLQETFVMAIRDVGHCRAQSRRSFLAWLTAVADNRMRDLRKGMQRAKRRGEKKRIEGPAAGKTSFVDLFEMLSGKQTSPSSRMARHDVQRAIQIGVASLPDDQRDAMTMTYLDGKGIEEVATQLGKSPGAVRGLLHRGKQALRETLGRSSCWFANK